jgi:hypothetical protein
MLRAFGFERVGVVVGDIYWLDPEPGQGQEGPEHGVRLEVRVFQRGELKGSIYSAQPINVDRPIWRVDLLESVDGNRPFDRTHHHPVFKDWNPGRRVFARELTQDPFGWLEAQLADLPGVLERAGLPEDTATAEDVAGLRETAPEIAGVAKSMLERVRIGELGRAPDDIDGNLVRSGWL